MTQNITPRDNNTGARSGFVRAISEPLSERGWPRWLVYVLSVLGGVYILNPTLGLFELIPDVLPVIGNIDESLAVMLVLAGIVEALEGKKERRAQKQATIVQTHAEPRQIEESKGS